MIISGTILALALSAFAADNRANAHNGPSKVPCVECHVRLPFPGAALSLRNDIGAACTACHERHHGADKMRSHPVDPVPSIKVPADMILDNQGRIVCITCHAFHGEYLDEDGNKRYYLRRTPGKTFCYSCHKNIPGSGHK